MSAIQPYLPPVQIPAQPGGQAASRVSRSDFFKAALDAVQATVPEAPARPAPAPVSAAATDDRSTRPGALLDIRV